MENLDDVLSILLTALKKNSMKENEIKISEKIPVGISNRHIHLAKKDVEVLFGKDYTLEKLKDLSQPGQYACNETVTVCGPRGAIEKVRILGPVRSKTQIEFSIGDCRKTGVSPMIRSSGDLKNTSGITIVGTKGSVHLDEGVIVAKRHIHMNLDEAKYFGVNDGQDVSVSFDGIRGGILNNVVIRTNSNYNLECHLDLEEANSIGINPKSRIKIVK